MTDAERPWSTTLLNKSRDFVVILGEDGKVWACDIGYQMRDSDYVSYAEKKNTDLDEQFDEMYLKGLEEVYFLQTGDWNFSTTGTNVPDTNVDIVNDKDTMKATIDGSEDYKMSVHQTSRFLHFRFDDEGLAAKARSIDGYSLNVDMGGKDT